jgi:Cof subfamily protein (haloacid dehalogenase superfamily)
MVADVDGTLVTREKILTERAIEAVRALHAADILFAVTSGRPPRGISMLIEPLQLQTPIAAFNGGLVVNPDMSVIERHVIPPPVVAPAVALLESFGLDVWLYRGADWFVRDLNGPHVDREAWTVRFPPTLVKDYDDLTEDIAKIVGVSDDHDTVAAASSAAHEQFGDHVSAARSQPYYVDITHPRVNKGTVVQYLASRYHIPVEQIAAIGDMPNDVLMFAHSGLSIVMGKRQHGGTALRAPGHGQQRRRGLRQRGPAVRAARRLSWKARRNTPEPEAGLDNRALHRHRYRGRRCVVGSGDVLNPRRVRGQMAWVSSVNAAAAR